MTESNRTKGIRLRNKIGEQIESFSNNITRFEIRENDPNLSVDLVIDQFRYNQRIRTWKIEVRSCSLFTRVKEKLEYRVNALDLRRLNPCDLVIVVIRLPEIGKDLVTLMIPYKTFENFGLTDKTRLSIADLFYKIGFKRLESKP
jgi:hypothetical protein